MIRRNSKSISFPAFNVLPTPIIASPAGFIHISVISIPFFSLFISQHPASHPRSDNFRGETCDTHIEERLVRKTANKTNFKEYIFISLLELDVLLILGHHHIPTEPISNMLRHR